MLSLFGMLRVFRWYPPPKNFTTLGLDQSKGLSPDADKRKVAISMPTAAVAFPWHQICRQLVTDSEASPEPISQPGRPSCICERLGQDVRFLFEDQSF